MGFNSGFTGLNNTTFCLQNLFEGLCLILRTNGNGLHKHYPTDPSIRFLKERMGFATHTHTHTHTKTPFECTDDSFTAYSVTIRNFLVSKLYGAIATP